MQKLSDALKSQESTIDPLLLDKAARDWADHSLKMYRGETLRKAMDISIALSEFTVSLEIKDA